MALTDGILVERELQYGQLIIPFDLRLETQNAFYLVHRLGRQLTYGMRSFYDWIFDTMKAE